MNQEQFWREFSSLPPNAQSLVIDFVTFLQTKYQLDRTEKMVNKPTKLSAEPFIGMWKDRGDLTDSSSYVRKLRTDEWGIPI